MEPELEEIMYALTLQARPVEKREKWLNGGFNRMNRKPGSILSYWKTRLAKADPGDIALHQKVLSEYKIHLANPQEKQVIPQPWPIYARPLKLLAISGDKGLGDIIARTIGPIGGDAYKAWFKLAFGKSCGCTERQNSLNQKFPI